MAPLASRRPAATLVDMIIIERAHSPSGVYVIERGTVRPLASLRGCGDATLLARTDGLRQQEISELAGQNIKLVYVREVHVSPGVCGVLVPESSASGGEVFGTRVVPYLVVGREQAEKISRLASMMPAPPESGLRDAAGKQDSCQAACFAPYGGC